MEVNLAADGESRAEIVPRYARDRGDRDRNAPALVRRQRRPPLETRIQRARSASAAA